MRDRFSSRGSSFTYFFNLSLKNLSFFLRVFTAFLDSKMNSFCSFLKTSFVLKASINCLCLDFKSLYFV